MLPYFRSMEAFFNLSLPTDWQSLSDSQLQYFFTQLSHDLPMEEILTLCLFKWADLRVLCKTHDGSYLVKQRHASQQEATLTIRQVQAATASLDFLRQFASLPVRITKIGRAKAVEADFQGVPFSTFISAGTSPDCFRISCSRCPVLQKTYLAMHHPSARCYGLL